MRDKFLDRSQYDQVGKRFGYEPLDFAFPGDAGEITRARFIGDDRSRPQFGVFPSVYNRKEELRRQRVGEDQGDIGNFHQGIDQGAVGNDYGSDNVAAAGLRRIDRIIGRIKALFGGCLGENIADRFYALAAGAGDQNLFFHIAPPTSRSYSSLLLKRPQSCFPALSVSGVLVALDAEI